MRCWLLCLSLSLSSRRNFASVCIDAACYSHKRFIRSEKRRLFVYIYFNPLLIYPDVYCETLNNFLLLLFILTSESRLGFELGLFLVHNILFPRRFFSLLSMPIFVAHCCCHMKFIIHGFAWRRALFQLADKPIATPVRREKTAKRESVKIWIRFSFAVHASPNQIQNWLPLWGTRLYSKFRCRFMMMALKRWESKVFERIFDYVMAEAELWAYKFPLLNGPTLREEKKRGGKQHWRKENSIPKVYQFFRANRAVTELYS